VKQPFQAGMARAFPLPGLSQSKLDCIPSLLIGAAICVDRADAKMCPWRGGVAFPQAGG
jgi:hypothetical protein